jgi:hypothetical protein
MKKILFIISLLISLNAFSQKTVMGLYDNGKFGKKVTVNNVVGQSPISIVTGVGGGAGIDTIKYLGGTLQIIPTGYVYRAIPTGAYGDSALYADTTKHWFGLNTTNPQGLFDMHVWYVGTVAANSTNTTVTGTGTFFLSDFKRYDTITINGVDAIVSSITSNTSLTLTANYSGTTGSGYAYYAKSAYNRGVWQFKSNGIVYLNGNPFIIGSYGSATTFTNLGIGYGVFGGNIGGYGNVAFGGGALGAIGTNAPNGLTAIGYQALLVNTTGTNNTAIGYQVLSSNTTGSNNTSIAGGTKITGSNNINIGNGMSGNTVAGSNNVGIGNGVMNNQGGTINNNVFIGGNGGQFAAGSNNTGVGYNSLIGVFGFSVGANNTALGYSSGANNKSGANTVCIGYQAQVLYNSSNTGNIGPGVLMWTANDGHDSIAATGALRAGIAVAAPTSTFQIGGSFSRKYNSTATGITLDGTYDVVEVTATGQTITLPTAASITGRVYTIKLTASGSSTIATTSSQTIDGSTTYSLSAQYKYVTVQSNGSNWIIIANN